MGLPTRRFRPVSVRPTHPAAASDINITPLIDVQCWCVLIIFMAAVPLTQKGVDVDLPPQVAQKPTRRHRARSSPSTSLTIA